MQRRCIVNRAAAQLSFGEHCYWITVLHRSLVHRAESASARVLQTSVMRTWELQMLREFWPNAKFGAYWLPWAIRASVVAEGRQHR